MDTPIGNPDSTQMKVYDREVMLGIEIRNRSRDLVAHLLADRPSFTHLEWLEVRRLAAELYVIADQTVKDQIACSNTTISSS